jgi:hypothetical protein
MARPKQKNELKRSRKVTVMYTGDEYDEIEANANEIEVTVSSFIRSRSLRGFVRVPKYANIDAKSVRELSRLGGLLKKHYTDTGGEHADKTGAILDDMAAIVLEVKRRLDDREAHNER